jgi:phospholipid transport system substrate-binding protein
MLRRAGLVLALVLGFSQAACATPSPDAARSLVDGMAGEAISTLSAPGRTDEQIRTKFHEILARNFDLPGIARFVLGRYWRIATPEQQTEYLKLFENYIVGIYANRFKNYSGETVQVTGAKPDGDNVTVASTINLSGGAQPVLVEWKIGDSTDGAPRVNDVIIEQVSMSLTQRSEFATLIQNNGGKVEALLAQLRAKTGAAAASSPAGN